MRKLSKGQKYLIILLVILLSVTVYVGVFGMQTVAYLCAEEVRARVIDIVNDSNELLQTKKMFYEDYFTVQSDGNGKIEFIKANTGLINQINMLIQTEIQNRLNELRTVYLHLPSGAFTGSTLFADLGSPVPVTAKTLSNCYTVLHSSFESLGINHTLHRLQIDCYVEITMLIPSRSVVCDVTNEILVAENVIVGEVPETYLGENITTDYLDLIPD